MAQRCLNTSHVMLMIAVMKRLVMFQGSQAGRVEEQEDHGKAGADAPQALSSPGSRGREDGPIPSSDRSRTHQHCQEACCKLTCVVLHAAPRHMNLEPSQAHLREI